MLERIQEIIIDYTRDKELVIKRNTLLQFDLGLDSYSVVQLICKLEEEFDLEIPDRVIGNLKTVQNLIEYLESHN